MESNFPKQSNDTDDIIVNNNLLDWKYVNIEKLPINIFFDGDMSLIYHHQINNDLTTNRT